MVYEYVNDFIVKEVLLNSIICNGMIEYKKSFKINNLFLVDMLVKESGFFWKNR